MIVAGRQCAAAIRVPRSSWRSPARTGLRRQGRGQDVAAYDLDQITGRRGGVITYVMTGVLPGSAVAARAGLAGDRGLQTARRSASGILNVLETSADAVPPLHVHDPRMSALTSWTAQNVPAGYGCALPLPRPITTQNGGSSRVRQIEPPTTRGQLERLARYCGDSGLAAQGGEQFG